MSLEFKGMFLYHASMVVLFALPMTGQLLDRVEYLFVAAAIALLITVASIVRRARARWNWRGAGIKEGVSVVILTVLFGFFALSLSGKFPPPAALMPWYLGVAGIYVFAALQFLNVVHLAEADFQAECGDAVPAPPVERPHEARWKRVVRAVFSVFFLAVWLEGVSFFYFHSRALEHGARAPAGEQTWSIVEKGTAYYVTKAEYDRVALLKTLFFIGVPTALATGAFLQFVLGIRMGGPTRKEESA